MRKFIISLAVIMFLIAICFGQVGCQTVSGIGRDISAMSDGMAEKHVNDRNRN